MQTGRRGKAGQARRRRSDRGPARLIWHIGDHKTGSTAIQEALHAVSGPELAYVTDRFNHTWLAHRLHKGVESRAARKGFLRLREMLYASEAPVAVVSAEEFEHVPPEILRAAIATYLPRFQHRLEVVAYVRPHLEAVRSRFCERVKLGTYFADPARLALSLHRQGVMPYAPRFSAWAAAFPGAFTLRPMVRDALAGRDAVTDFFKVIGVEGAVVPPVDTVNRALTAEDLAAVRLVQAALIRAGMTEGPRAHLGRTLGGLLTADPDPTHHPVRLPATLCRLLEWQYKADAAALDKVFFDGDVVRRALARAMTEESKGASGLPRRRLPEGLAASLADRGRAVMALPYKDRAAAIETLAQELVPQIRAMPVVASGMWPGWRKESDRQ